MRPRLTVNGLDGLDGLDGLRITVYALADGLLE